MHKILALIQAGLILTGLALTPVNQPLAYDPSVMSILGDMDQVRWMDWIAAFSGEKPIQTAQGEGRIRTRSSFVMFEPNTNPNAFTYLQETLMQLGFKPGIDFEVHTYDFPYSERHWERNWKNLVLTLPGSDPALADERVLLVAHLDSTSNQEQNLAPGADDNATGSAGLLEAAAVFRHYQFARTIHLVWFSGEEQSRRGSEFFVEDYAEWLPDIVGVVNLDMFGHDADDDRCFEVHAGVLPGSSQIAETMSSVIETYSLELTFDFMDDKRAYRLSDHAAFWNLGVPAVMVTENSLWQPGETCGKVDYNPAYHTTADSTTYLNPETGFSILQAALGTVAHLATPSGVCFETAPEVVGYTDRVRRYLKWDLVEESAFYQLWERHGEQRQLLGETSGSRWIIPSIAAEPAGVIYEVVALTGKRCQSQIGLLTP